MASALVGANGGTVGPGGGLVGPAQTVYGWQPVVSGGGREPAIVIASGSNR